MNPVGFAVTLTGYGLFGLTLLVVGTLCLVGLLLGALVALGHLLRRRRDDDEPEPERPDAIGRGSALDSFRWEDSTE